MNTLFAVVLLAGCATAAFAAPRLHDPLALPATKDAAQKKSLRDNNVYPANNITLAAYGGLWHEFARSPNFFEIGLKCVTAEYALQTDGSVSVDNRGIRMYPWVNPVSEVRGSARVPNAAEPAKLQVSFNGMPRPDADSTNYWIVNTDYVQYSIVFSPANGFLSPASVFILTRQQMVSQGLARAVLNELAIKTGFTASDLIFTNQRDC